MADPTRRFRPFRGREIAFRITLAYLAVAIPLILLFEQILATAGLDPETVNRLHRDLGFAFIFSTAIVIYILVKRYVSAMDRGEQILRDIVKSVAVATGEAFFHTLVENLSLRLDADHAFVGRIDGKNPNRVKVLAVFSRGRALDNFEYDLGGTPCANVLAGHPCCIPKNVQGQYPHDVMLKQMRVESYIGTPLYDSSGNPMGLLVVMDGKPIRSHSLAESMLQIFALRAAAELERLRTEEAILHMAYFDALTDLPNSRLFVDRLNRAIRESSLQTGQIGVLFLDLDRFKTISRTIGHTVGEQLLRAIAKRLQHSLKPQDVLARMGDDEFGIILPGIEKPEDAAGTADKILENLKKTFTFVEHELHVSASIGIAIYPHDGTEVETLLKNADAAMSRTKEMGKNNYQFYFPELNEWSMHSLILENKLHQALGRNEFTLFYQPQLNLRTGVFDGMEALVSWRHPDRAAVSPADFIPLAEETGLIEPIGEWILRTACEQNRKWQLSGLPPQKVSVNLSARQFNQLNVSELVGRVLRETGLDSRWLALEITESALMQDVEMARKTLQKLKEMGVTIVIDDFGTGYSSLSYLKQFPIQTLKIDRSFVVDLPTDPDDRGISAAIIAMAHTLGMDVVAEGVEREEQQTYLASRGCDKIQGFLFHPPLRADELASMLALGRVEGVSAG